MCDLEEQFFEQDGSPFWKMWERYMWFTIATIMDKGSCCNHVPVSTERISTLKRGREGFGYRQKRCFLKLRKDADRKRLFCSNVSTLLSMIVGTHLKSGFNF